MVITMDDRAVSSAVSFALALAIITTLVTLMMYSGSGIVDNQQEQLQKQVLHQSAEKVAAGIISLDKLESGSERTIETPSSVAGQRYTITIESTGSTGLYEITATTNSVTVTTFVSTQTSIDTPVTVNGGEILITHDESSDTLVVSNE